MSTSRHTHVIIAHSGLNNTHSLSGRARSQTIQLYISHKHTTQSSSEYDLCLRIFLTWAMIKKNIPSKTIVIYFSDSMWSFWAELNMQCRWRSNYHDGKIWDFNNRLNPSTLLCLSQAFFVFNDLGWEIEWEKYYFLA